MFSKLFINFKGGSKMMSKKFKKSSSLVLILVLLISIFSSSAYATSDIKSSDYEVITINDSGDITIPVSELEDGETKTFKIIWPAQDGLMRATTIADVEVWISTYSWGYTIYPMPNIWAPSVTCSYRLTNRNGFSQGEYSASGLSATCYKNESTKRIIATWTMVSASHSPSSISRLFELV